MQFFNANESVIDVSIGSYEDSGFEDYQFSSNSMIPNGYSFERGPYIYSVKTEGTTYYYQNAVPVFRYESSSYVDYQISSHSVVPNSFHFERGQYIYTVEAGGTTFYYQNAVPVFSISEVPQSSNCCDVSSTLLSTSSNILDNGNLEISKPNEMVKKSEESKSAVKSDPISDFVENDKVINSVEHNIHINNDGTSNIKTNKKEEVKKEDKRLELKVKHSIKNQDCVRSCDVSKSEKELKLSSLKGDKFCNLEENKKIKQKHKNVKAKAFKLVENEISTGKTEVCMSELIEKIRKVDELPCSVISDEICDVNNSVEHKNNLSSEEICNLETNNKIKPEVPKIIDKEKTSLRYHNCVQSTDASKSEGIEKVTKSVCSKDSFKCNEVCNSEQNKKKKRKNKKRKLKIKESVAIKEYVNNNEVCKLDLNESIQKSEAERASVKSDELCYSKVNVKESHDVGNSEYCKKTKRKSKKRQSKFKESVEMSAKNDEIFNLDLNDTIQKSEEHNPSFKTDERCTSKVNGKESSEVGNSEQKKKKKRKIRKRKPKVKKSVEIKESVESVEICNLDLNETPEKKVCYEKSLSESTNNVILNFDGHQEIDTETVYFNEDSNLDSSEKDALLNEKREITTTPIDNFHKSSEVDTVVVTDDIIKSVDIFPVIKSEQSDFNEVDFQKTAEEQREKSKIILSGTVESLYENNNSVFELSEQKSICVDGKEKINSVHQDHGKSKPIRSNSSSVEQFHSHYDPVFELLDPNSDCSNGNIEFKLFGQDSVNFKECVSSSKTEELTDRNFHVPSHQSNSRLALPVRETETPCEDTSISTASREVKKKKKRFQKVRKWFTDLCSCMRKNNE